MSELGSKSPRHTWGDKERIVLSMLKIYYDLTSEQIRMIFNSMFLQTLSSEGFSAGLPMNRIAAQLHDLAHNGAGSHCFDMVVSKPGWELRQSFYSLLIEVENTAKSLGIHLHLQSQPRTVRTTQSIRHPRKRRSTTLDDTSVTSMADLGSSDSDIPSRSKTLSKRSVQDTRNSQESSRLGRIPPVLRINYDVQGQKTRQHPFLLFRAFDVSHGVTARRFIHSNYLIPQPPAFESARFKQQVFRHLMIETTYSSPFISLAESPSNAINRIRLDDLRYLAIWAFNDIAYDCQLRYGENSGPWLVPVICSKHKLQDSLPKRYSGIGEWLVWGTVTCEPIAILNTPEAYRLQAVMKTMDFLSLQSGERLGLCLDMISDKYKEVIAYKLIRSYRVRGFLTAPRSLEYQQFIQGVYHATQGRRQASILPDMGVDALHTPLQVLPPTTNQYESGSRNIGLTPDSRLSDSSDPTNHEMTTNDNQFYNELCAQINAEESTNLSVSPADTIDLTVSDDDKRKDEQIPTPDASESDDSIRVANKRYHRELQRARRQ